ncbi:2-dehydro-3-deoxygalactonokinase [Albidovulum sediminicola]|uniref:2-dehydro-3-deoxygalactonokinase n=1 Tax=Albidovulum sediminicola TaxID=2984331 RepID=A0ABT2YWY1_9RHOB|nr:2-dehydro-3-deoxygalactonokinase [Defluviimonas sp. WL0075]MCV2863381.1 2-dehydro-3-deoxygalactonokinase [Defluviimonas sp. WL0075]
MDGNGVDWIGVDWGSTRVRATALGAGGVLDQRDAPNTAMAGAASHEALLLDLVGGWLRPGVQIPVLACGMVGSRQGWVEVPYRKVPAAMDLVQGLSAAPVQDPRLRLWIAPGLSQESPAEVMRGEETQIAGFLAGNPDFDGVLCLPGTHSKWVHISAREVVSFRTAMTGELFALLSSQSVLRHSVGGPDAGTEAGTDAGAFVAALGQTLSRPERLAAELFSIRSESLLHGLGPDAARARLSGLLIGAELAAMRPYWLGQRIAVIGANGLSQTYVRALAEVGVTAETADGAAMALAGLVAIRSGLAGQAV